MFCRLWDADRTDLNDPLAVFVVQCTLPLAQDSVHNVRWSLQPQRVEVLRGLTYTSVVEYNSFPTPPLMIDAANFRSGPSTLPVRGWRLSWERWL